MSDYFLGIDIGSASSKAGIINEQKIVASVAMPSGNNYEATSAVLKRETLKKAGLREEDVIASASTGIGGRSAVADSYHGVIVCDARGGNYLYPSVRTIIDIGGQGSQIITIDEQGKVIDFKTSEICATGSARVLQVVARILQITMDEIGPLSLKSSKPSGFSTSCTVFLETEVITRISQGDSPADILAGINSAIADKISSMSRGVKLLQDVIVIGGGALDTGLMPAIEKKLGIKVSVPDNPLTIAALGAAVIAREQYYAGSV